MQVDLALCCKAMLPLLCTGHVGVHLYKRDGGRALTQATRCLLQQPDGVSHLKLYAQGSIRGTRQLIDLGCAHALQTLPAWAYHCPIALLCQCLHQKHTGWGPGAVMLCADAVCCPTCATWSWTALISPCQRCSRLPRGCRVWRSGTVTCGAAQRAFSARAGLP